MPYTARQRRAAFAELSRREHGGGAKNFRGMGAADLETYARSKTEENVNSGTADSLKVTYGGKKAKARRRGTSADQAAALKRS